MASIWSISGKGPATKVYGLMHPAEVVGHFNRLVDDCIKRGNMTTVSRHDMEAILKRPDGAVVAFYIEPLSPPSAPEKGQPKRLPTGRGVLVDSSGETHILGEGN